jgi:hypothetical protein
MGLPAAKTGSDDCDVSKSMGAILEIFVPSSEIFRY